MLKTLSFVILLSYLGTTACVSIKPVYYEDDKAVARKKIDQLHDLYNREEFAAIHGLMTERLKNEQSKEQFVSTLAKMKETNGAFIEANEIDSQVVQEASYREVRLKYSSRLEKGWCDEGFALFVDGNKAVIDLVMMNPADGPKRKS